MKYTGYTAKALAAVFALTMVLSGCGGAGEESSAAPAPTEAVTAAPQETVTTTMSGNGIIFETEEPMETMPPAETVTETAPVTTTAPAVEIDVNAPEVISFGESTTAAFCQKLKAGYYDMTFDIYGGENGAKTSYTAIENEGLTYVKQAQSDGVTIEFYIFSYAAYTITTQNGVKGELMTMETNGANMVESLAMFGLIDNAKIVSVEEKDDGTVVEKAVFEVAGKTESGEYTYDKTTGALKSAKSGSSVLKMTSYKGDSEDIPLPVELGGTGTDENQSSSQVEGGQTGETQEGYTDGGYDYGYEDYGYTEDVYW